MTTRNTKSSLLITLITTLSALYITDAFLPINPTTNYLSTLPHSNPIPERTNHHLFQPPITTTTTTTSLRLANKKSGTKKKKPNIGTITVNRVARRNYEVISTYEAGISLLGSEVKAIREGKMTLRDGYVRPIRGGRSCTLFNVHIGKNPSSGEFFQHEERRPRPLLLNKDESMKLNKAVERQGVTVVPLKAYFNEKNMVKIQIGLCRGKNQADKRNTIRDREAKKDTERMIKNFRAN